MMLTKKVSSFINEQKLILPEDSIIAAVSGGRDSVCLLYILDNLRKKYPFTLSAIHVNHGLRVEDSDKDEEFVTELCSSIGIVCTSFKLKGFTNKSGENVLRNARYSIFDNQLSKIKNCKIATAHHLNDQLETYLMRLFKGSGVKGLLAIPISREGYIRPLLSSTRDDIDEYCEQNSISFREDLSNKETDKLRNNIRHNLVPEIKKIFGVEFLKQFQKSHQEFADLYFENFESNRVYFEKIIQSTSESIEIVIIEFEFLSYLKKRQFLEYCFYYVCGLNSPISKEQLEEFGRFVATSQTGSKFLIFDQLEILKNRDKLVFSVKKESNPESNYLVENGIVKFAESNISIKQVTPEEVQLNSNPLEEFIDGGKLKFPLRVRSWCEGDFFQPLGKNIKQKMSDFFINNKISKNQKSKIPLVLNNDEIVWIAGYRISNKYKITKSVKTFYKLELKK